MKQVCLLCERTSPGGDLFCQETYCPAEMSPTILDHGDMLGDIEIVKSVSCSVIQFCMKRCIRKNGCCSRSPILARKIKSGSNESLNFAIHTAKTRKE